MADGKRFCEETRSAVLGEKTVILRNMVPDRPETERKQAKERIGRDLYAVFSKNR